VDLTAEEIAWKQASRSASVVVQGVLESLRLDQRHAELEIIKVWNHLLDPNIACHAQPVGLRRGTLFVNVDSNVWLTEIVRWRRQEILERLQTSFGSQMIKRISFRVE
jgi:predicted nucleic acid-binding Zn ribbon protein